MKDLLIIFFFFFIYRSRRSSRVTKLPTSSAVGGGTSRQTVVRARAGMSGTDTGQELPSNPFSSEGNSILENAGNPPGTISNL